MAALILLAAGSLACGCARQQQYRVSELPPELLAPRTVNLQQVNLSSLSDSPISPEIVQPGDVIEVSMVTDFTKLSATVTPLRVVEDGTVAVPLIGHVRVAGLTLEEAERAIAVQGHTREIYRNPAITVTMKQPRSVRVTVVGAVTNPGPYTLTRGNTSLMAALVAAGGLAEDATPEVEIRRAASGAIVAGRPPSWGGHAPGVMPVGHFPPDDSVRLVKVDLSSAGPQSPEARQVYDGDVIHVAPQPVRNVYVLGLVRKPGEFPIPPGEQLRLLDVIAMAGGSSNAAADKVLIVRHPPGQESPVNILASIGQAKSGSDNLPLAPGDTVVIEQTPKTIIVDALQSVVRFTVGGSSVLF